MITDINIILDEIEEMKQKALEEYASNWEIDINAYCTGYELGYADALSYLMSFIKEED